MQEITVFDRIADLGIVAIVRAQTQGDAVAMARSLYAAGCGVIEISFNTPGAAEAIAECARVLPESCIGAGTVLGVDEARAAVRAGARFLLSPVYEPMVAAVAADHGLLYVPGVFSAREVWEALRSGCQVLKLFPASVLGVTGMRALLEPFGPVAVLPTGGIGVGEVTVWRGAGAMAVGLGGTLTKSLDPAGAVSMALAAARTMPKASGSPRHSKSTNAAHVGGACEKSARRASPAGFLAP